MLAKSKVRTTDNIFLKKQQKIKGAFLYSFVIWEFAKVNVLTTFSPYHSCSSFTLVLSLFICKADFTTQIAEYVTTKNTSLSDTEETLLWLKSVQRIACHK